MSKVKVKDFIKSQCAKKGMTIKELGDKVGKSPSTMSGILCNNKLTMNTFSELMKGIGEEVKIVTEDGNIHTLDID
jgi:transcriptional regulator with XRE-family HTH domain